MHKAKQGLVDLIYYADVKVHAYSKSRHDKDRERALEACLYVHEQIMDSRVFQTYSEVDRDSFVAKLNGVVVLLKEHQARRARDVMSELVASFEDLVFS